MWMFGLRYVAVLAISLLLRCDVCHGMFNLFLQSQEVFRLLGLKAELFYVRDGKVNDYALKFEMLVPAQISELYFSWQNLKPTEIYYSFNVTSTNQEALTSQFNISSQGVIPHELKVFKLKLLCNGKVNAEVEVHFNLNITHAPSNVTQLQLRRKKICLTEDSFNGTLYKSDRMAARAASMNNYLYVILGSIFGVVLLSTILLTSCCIARKKHHRTTDTIRSFNHRFKKIQHCITAVPQNFPDQLHDPHIEQENYLGYDRTSSASQAHAFLRVETPNNGSIAGSYSSYHKVPSSSVASHQGDSEFKAQELTEHISEILVDKHYLRLQTKIQEGTFSQIFCGLFTESITEKTNSQYVMVKTVTSQASPAQVSLLLSEGMRLYGANHRNILPVIGVCMDNPVRPQLLYPYMNRGNLKKFLQACKLGTDESLTLVSQDLVSMAIELVQGMIYLHKKGIIHKDLATRNCVVDEYLHVRIADTALSRDLFPHDYHCLGDNENRPVKWLAYESLVNREFSPSSDVWAFGVTLWELLTLGQQPYVEVDPFEMAVFLRDGYRLTQPINCPDQLYTMMAYCWVLDADDRPTFGHLLDCLQDFSAALGRYI